MKRFMSAIGRALGIAGRATVALVGICGISIAVANYAVTVGSGTNFGSVVVGGVHYAQQFICDLTTPAQCASVDSSGILSVKSSTLASAANQSTEITALNSIVTNTGAALPAGTANIGNVGQINPYPTSSIPYTASTTGTTGATTATLAGAGSVTTYICGFSVRSNATAAATGNITVTGTISATMNFTHWTAPLASGIGLSEMIFNPCVPASGVNQSVAVVSPAPGTGGVISVTAWGYKL